MAVAEQIPNTASPSAPSPKLNEWGVSEETLAKKRQQTEARAAEAAEHNKNVPARFRGEDGALQQDAPEQGALQRLNQVADNIAEKIYDSGVKLFMHLKGRLNGDSKELNQQEEYNKRSKLGRNYQTQVAREEGRTAPDIQIQPGIGSKQHQTSLSR